MKQKQLGLAIVGVCLLLAQSLWAGGVTVQLNQSSYLPGDTMAVSVAVDASAVNASQADINLAVIIPGYGPFFLLQETNWAVTDVPLMQITSVEVPTLPAGTYTWYLVLSQVGGNVYDSSSWLAYDTASFDIRSSGTDPLTGEIPYDTAQLTTIASEALAESGAQSTADLSQLQTMAQYLRTAARGLEIPDGLIPDGVNINDYIPTDTSNLSTSIPGFTWDSAQNAWVKDATVMGASVKLYFYKTDETEPLTVNITEVTNYLPGGALYGVNPLEGGLSMKLVLDIDRTFPSGYTMKCHVESAIIALTASLLDANATTEFSGGSGTVTGAFGQYSVTNFHMTVTGQGASITGGYDFAVSFDEASYNGSATFNKDGCTGATIKNSEGEVIGTAIIDSESGKLMFTDAQTGETRELTGVQ